jgi:hypothetical protein
MYRPARSVLTLPNLSQLASIKAAMSKGCPWLCLGRRAGRGAGQGGRTVSRFAGVEDVRASGCVATGQAERGVWCGVVGGRLISDNIQEHRDGDADFDPLNIQVLCPS